jgi:FtsZ-binding cell division protein ZapB
MGGDMQEDQLELLESRINNAIAFIENLRSREKGFVQENEDLHQKIVTLEENMAEKEKKIEELKGSQGFLREKIEAILGKLESFASIDTERQFNLKNYPEQEKTESLTGEEMPGVQTEQVIIEENIVDLKEDFSLLEPDETVTKGENVSADEEVIQDEAAQTGEEISGGEEVLPDEEVIQDGAARTGEEISGSEEVLPDEEVIQDGAAQTGEEISGSEEVLPDEEIIQDGAAQTGEEILSEESEKPLDLPGDAQNKNDNMLFAIENDIDSDNLLHADNGNNAKKTRGESYNKKWLDNNPFIET